jgi:hypothetical protein
MAVEATTAAGASAGTSVTAAIRKASQVTGARFGYLLATAKVESNLNPNAAARTSSAGGLFQFIDRTWLGTLKEAGGLVGYSRYADAISRTDDGRYIVNDPAMRGEIMALRQDPTANALMAGIFTNSNTKHLTNKLGRAPTDGELYMAHFMGATGAARLITSAENNPSAVAAQSFPSAARANRSIFFDKSGRARNFAEVAQNLAGRYDAARSRVANLNVAETAASPSTSFVAETARVARAYQVADAGGQLPAVSGTSGVQQAQFQPSVPGERVFSNPYRSGGGVRPQPVSTAVAELWAPKIRTVQQEQARHIARDLETKARAQQTQTAEAAPQTVAPTQTTQTTETGASTGAGALGLFQDSKPDVRSLFTHGVRG